MKKRAQNLLTLILVLSLCLSCMLMPHAADAAASVTVHSQSELTNAFSTLAASGGTITLGADITLDGAVSLPAVKKAVTLNGDGHTLTLSGDLALNGDTELQNITICNDGDSRLISCGGHTVRFDATVSCTATDLFYPTIAGGNADSTAYSGGELTIGGGTWQRVLSGNAGTGASAQSGKVSITGGSFEEAVQVGGAGQMASGSKITMHITDGSFKDGIVFFSTKETATANLSLLVSGGNFAGKIRVSDEAGTLNGSCNLRMVGGEFSNCTGIEGWTGNGNLKANLNVSHALSESMFTLYADDTLDTTLLRTGVADPCLVYVNGFYYLTMTGSKNIALLKADRLSKLSQLTLGSNIAYRSASDATAVQTFGYDDLSGTWSPELHYFSEDDFPGQSGWYMYLALRNNSGDSSEIRMVTLRSANSNAPESPFVNPKTQVINNSQPILDKDGEIIAEWGCGMSVLRIEEGEYKGIYAMWVAEENRGTIDFAQKIMIAKMKSPWELASEPTAILHPTQRDDQCRDEFEVICIETELQHDLQHDIVDDRADRDGKQLQPEIGEQLAEDHFADDDGGKTDDDRAAPHVDVARTLVLREQRARKRDQPVGQHQPEDDVAVRIDALCARHARIVARGAERAALLGAEEPVQHGDHRKGEDDQHRQRIVKRQLAHIALRQQQVILIHADRLVCLAAHDTQIDRIEGKLRQNAGKDRRNAAARVEQSRDKPGKHARKRGADERQPRIQPRTDENDADRSAGCQRAVHRQIRDVQNAEGDVNADGHDAPDEPLRDRARHRIE